MSCIIIATDFSPNADRAFLRSLILAGQSGMTVLIAHAIGDSTDPSVLADLRTAAGQKLRALCTAASASHGVNAQWAVLDGMPEAALPRLASERGAQLLVLGPHAPEPIRDLLLGRKDKKLVGQLTCPLLFANGLPANSYQKVLIATDLSADAAHAAATAAKLLRNQGATILLYHAFHPRPFGGIAASAVSRDTAEQLRGARQAELEQQLVDFAASAGLSATKVMAEPATGSAASMILRRAKSESADIVVAGTQGKSAAQRILLGSVAEDLLRDAPQDLLLVPYRAA